MEDKLHQELQNVLAGRIPTTDDLPNLTYTRMVIQETMRLYPPVWGYVRDAASDDIIDGYRIPAGSMVMLSPYITHRHPAYWDNPEGFSPERFSPENSEGRHRYAYFPFGAGPRRAVWATSLPCWKRRWCSLPLPNASACNWRRDSASKLYL